MYLVQYRAGGSTHDLQVDTYQVDLSVADRTTLLSVWVFNQIVTDQQTAATAGCKPLLLCAEIVAEQQTAATALRFGI